jgi:hypothetical protein
VEPFIRKERQNNKTINSGISKGNRNGKATPIIISITKAKTPRRISPTPAKINTNKMDTQNKTTPVITSSHILEMESNGLWIALPLIVIDTPEDIHPQTQTSAIRITDVRASFFIDFFFF